MLFSTILVSYPQTTEYFVHIPPSDGIDCPRAVSQSLQLCTVNSLSTLKLYCPQAVQHCTSLLHNEDIALRQYSTSLSFLYQCMQHLTLLFFFSYRSFFCNLQFCSFSSLSSFLSFFFNSVLFFSFFFFSFQILLLVPRIVPIALLPLLNSS